TTAWRLPSNGGCWTSPVSRWRTDLRADDREAPGTTLITGARCAGRGGSWTVRALLIPILSLFSSPLSGRSFSVWRGRRTLPHGRNLASSGVSHVKGAVGGSPPTVPAGTLLWPGYKNFSRARRRTMSDEEVSPLPGLAGFARPFLGQEGSAARVLHARR